MKLKTKFLAIALLITTVALGQGQNRPGKDMSPEESAQKRADTMKAKLKLSDTQYTQVYDQILSNEKQMRAHREAMKKMREENDEKMKSILTPEQYTQLKEMMEQRKKMMKERRNQGDNQPDSDSPPELK
jgi:protein CpxP